MDDNMIKLELGATELTLHSEEAVPAVSATKELTEHYLEQQTLSPEEQQQVDAFSEKIDLHDSAIILQYGAACQKKVAAFSDTVLEGVRTKDLGETGEMIANLVTELKGFSAEEEKSGFLGFFKRSGSRIARLKARYDKAETNIDRIVEELEGLLSHVEEISECMVYGKEVAGEKELVITVRAIPDYERIAELHGEGLSEEDIYKLIWEQIRQVNRKVSNYKTIKKLEIKKGEFEKTSTQKIKRYAELKNNSDVEEAAENKGSFRKGKE